jgi:hypothetical protein
MPHSSQLSKNVVPAVREFIEARLRESLNLLKTDIDQRVERGGGCSSCSCKDDFAEIKKRLEFIEQRYSEDDRYALTRGKIFQLMHELGIE